MVKKMFLGSRREGSLSSSKTPKDIFLHSTVRRGGVIPLFFFILSLPGVMSGCTKNAALSESPDLEKPLSPVVEVSPIEPPEPKERDLSSPPSLDLVLSESPEEIPLESLLPPGIADPRYRPRGNEFTRATDLYGPLSVNVGRFFVDTFIRPWSGSWLPYHDPALFKDADSVLAKYDRYVLKTRGKQSEAALFEETHFYRPRDVLWSGRCDAWALASTLEPDLAFLPPEVELNGIRFTRSELLSLLTVTYEEFEGAVQFGQRFNGDYKSIYEDIYPDQFHKLLQVELFGKKRPVIMDRDAGVEIWNVPLYLAEVLISVDPEHQNILKVKTVVQTAKPLSQMSNANTDLIKNLTHTYTYDLYGYPQLDGSFKVVFGIWTGDSVWDHPDFLWALPEVRVRKSKNQEVDVTVVEELLERALTSPVKP